MRYFVLLAVCFCSFAVSADEPWMYPLKLEKAKTRAQLDSITTRQQYAESAGQRYAENTSRTVAASVASFEDIVKWYSDRLKVPDVATRLADFNRRVAADPGFSLELGSGPRSDPKSALVSCWFSADHKQIATILEDDDGSVVSIVLLGTADQTRIQVMRRRID